MTRRLIDCGFIVGILEPADDGSPMLTLLQPETDDSDAKTLVIWNVEGLDNLRDALGEYLDEWAERTQNGEQNGPVAD